MCVYIHIKGRAVLNQPQRIKDNQRTKNQKKKEQKEQKSKNPNTWKVLLKESLQVFSMSITLDTYGNCCR